MVNPPELYHRILDVPRGTSPQELRAAYKGLAKKWHPDKHPPSSKPEAEARFKAITEAYEVSEACRFPFGDTSVLLAFPRIAIRPDSPCSRRRRLL
jgi:hypothetical protein